MNIHREQVRRRLIDQINNLPEGELVITMSDGRGALIPLLMKPEQKVAIDLFINSSSAQGPLIKSPIRFKMIE